MPVFVCESINLVIEKKCPEEKKNKLKVTILP